MEDTAAFDPDSYKAEILSQSEEAAPGWRRWRRLIEEWLGPPTDVMLDAARIQPGNTILDVAAGTGGQTIAAAQRLRGTGRVIGIDFSPQMLSLAKVETELAGLGNISFRLMDAERLGVLPTCDAVISRIGLTYFPSLAGTMRLFQSILKPGGVTSAALYSRADANGFLAIPLGVLRRHGLLAPSAAGQPGPFSLSDRSELYRTFVDAGFERVEIDVVRAPLRFATVAESVHFVRDCFVGIGRAMAPLNADQRDALWREIADMYQEFEGSSGVALPAELLVVSGTKASRRGP